MLARSKELINADIHSFEIMQMAWLQTSELDTTKRLYKLQFEDRGRGGVGSWGGFQRILDNMK